MNNKMVHLVAFILLIVGGLNWLLAAFNFNVVGLITGGDMSTIAKIIYILVGLAALYEVFTHKSRCRACDAGGSSPAPTAGGGM